ncbi:MAG: stage IV sporulation protein A, partial [Lachnospiraceae bacterium]|nr:stage IV sporulation protein A [Lachnospiraceae bacterium]
MNHTYDLYRDIRERCRGEIYIGVVGPVRTGKSTFIGKFMEELILPLMTDPAAKARAVDELPQSAGGRTVTTTEPKFVPNEAAEIRIGDEIKMKVRLIDCVGYMVDGAVGHMEGDAERMVKTPWSDELIPFTKAAETGTDKVMKDHSTIGLVITTDGSIGDLSAKQYQEAQAKTIRAMKETGKPFIVLVNSKNPYSEEALRIASGIEETEGITAMTINCEQ